MKFCVHKLNRQFKKVFTFNLYLQPLYSQVFLYTQGYIINCLCVSLRNIIHFYLKRYLPMLMTCNLRTSLYFYQYNNEIFSTCMLIFDMRATCGIIKTKFVFLICNRDFVYNLKSYAFDCTRFKCMNHHLQAFIYIFSICMTRFSFHKISLPLPGYKGFLQSLIPIVQFRFGYKFIICEKTITNIIKLCIQKKKKMNN